MTSAAHKRQILSSEEIADAAARYRDGEKMQSIADRLGVTLQAVWYCLKVQRLGGEESRSRAASSMTA